jgi:hypothetical protein
VIAWALGYPKRVVSDLSLLSAFHKSSTNKVIELPALLAFLCIRNIQAGWANFLRVALSLSRWVLILRSVARRRTILQLTLVPLDCLTLHLKLEDAEIFMQALLLSKD